MKKLSHNATLIKNYLRTHKMSTIEELIDLLSRSKPTINRNLSELEYMTSISHSGKFYTMKKNPPVNEHGIWVNNSVSFSTHGTLAQTIKHIVESSDEGYTSIELKDILNIAPNDKLISLIKSSSLIRKKFNGAYTYFTTDKKKQNSQLEKRKLSSEKFLQVPGTSESTSDEIKTYIVIFYCLLNEKQKRIYAGLEALKFGKGGDAFVSRLLGVDLKTVAKGRHELESDDVLEDSIRHSGGGRVSVKKKRPK